MLAQLAAAVALVEYAAAYPHVFLTRQRHVVQAAYLVGQLELLFAQLQVRLQHFDCDFDYFLSCEFEDL